MLNRKKETKTCAVKDANIILVSVVLTTGWSKDTLFCHDFDKITSLAKY